MAMSAATLATQLENLTPTDNESAAAVVLAEAYRVFALAAVGNGVPILPSGPLAGKTAMIPALAGMSTPGAGASALESGVRAFWLAAATVAACPGSIAVVPPPTVGLAAALLPVFASNTSTSATLSQAANAVASVMYANAIVGGTVTLPGPSVGPIL